jgi:hypothetical protein
MFIQGALANVNSAVTTEEFLAFLSEQVPDGSYFKLQPPPGSIMAASIDWQVFLRDAAAIATISTALWGAYEKFIEPLHQEDPKSSAAIFIQIKNDKGESDQFMIGTEIKNKEILIHRFEESSKRLYPNKKGNEPAEEIEEIKRSGYWIQIK